MARLYEWRNHLTPLESVELARLDGRLAGRKKAVSEVLDAIDAIRRKAVQRARKAALSIRKEDEK